MRTSTRALAASVMTLMLMVGAFAGVSFAQDAGDLDCPEGFVPDVDDENYPICVEDAEVIDVDLVREDPEVAGAVIERPKPETDTTVLGVTLARTGGDLVPLIVAGLMLAGLGGTALLFARRRRMASPGS